MLVKELGVAAGGGRDARGRASAVMAPTLTGWGVPMAGVVLADGSGLSNDNRVTCDVLVGVLARHTADRPARRRPAVAGVSGTLSDVFTDSRRRPGGCRPRPARSATPRTTPTRRR